MSRCIECSRPKDAHLEGLKCPWQYNTKYSTMDLPEGAHCSDCRFVRRCSAFIGDVANNTTCDWFPIRFVPKFVASPSESPAAAGESAPEAQLGQHIKGGDQ